MENMNFGQNTETPPPSKGKRLFVLAIIAIIVLGTIVWYVVSSPKIDQNLYDTDAAPRVNEEERQKILIELAEPRAGGPVSEKENEEILIDLQSEPPKTLTDEDRQKILNSLSQ